METLEKSFKSLNEKMEEFEKKFKDEGAALFKEICQEIFDKFPEVDSFSWTQYTPYFNDGDECVFSVNEVDRINGYDEYGDESEDGEGLNIFENYSYNDTANRSYEIVEALRTFINSAPESVLRALFNDHSRITIFRNGEPVSEEYEHE